MGCAETRKYSGLLVQGARLAVVAQVEDRASLYNQRVPSKLSYCQLQKIRISRGSRCPCFVRAELK